MVKKPYSLPKKEIIKGKKRFEEILRTGKRFKKGELKVFVSCGNKRRAAFAVSKRVGKAVLRNKIKRWLREIYRKEKHLLKNDVELIILVSSINEETNYNVIEENLLEILKDINKYTE